MPCFNWYHHNNFSFLSYFVIDLAQLDGKELENIVDTAVMAMQAHSTDECLMTEAIQLFSAVCDNKSMLLDLSQIVYPVVQRIAYLLLKKEHWI